MEITEDENIDFFKLENDIERNIRMIWDDVILPYIDLDDNILNLNENDFRKFESYFYDNSKYYTFIRKVNKIKS